MSLTEPSLGGLEPTPIRQGGPPARAVIGVFAIGLLAVVGIGVFGQSATPPTPERTATPSIATVSSPTPVAPPTPTPAPTLRAGGCQTGLAPITNGIPRHPLPLRPPPLVSIAAGGGMPYQVVASGDSFWSIGSGRLTMSDPAGGTTRQWDYLDDQAFGSYVLSPARGGGVWLTGFEDIRWFDGESFADVIPSPTVFADLSGVGEASDGSIWATMYRGPAQRWDGTGWTALCDDRGAPQEGTSKVALAPDGTAWVMSGIDLIHYDLTGAMLGSVTIPDVEQYGADSMTVAADGSVWVAASQKVQRFDGAWTVIRDSNGVHVGAMSLTAADDGSVWAAAATIDGSCCPNVARFDGTGVQFFTAAEGLGAASGDIGINSIAVHGADVIVMSTDGTYRIPADGSGSRVWSRFGPTLDSAPDAASISSMVVDGNDQLVAASGDRLLEIRGGGWKAIDLPGLAPGSGSIDGLVRAADGAIAIATTVGAMVRSDGRWTVLEPKPTIAIAFDSAGACWLAPGGSDPNTGETLQEHSLYRFTRRGARWVRSPVAVPDGLSSIDSFTIGPDGDVWLRGQSADGTMSIWRRHGKRWTRVPDLPGPDASWSGRKLVVTRDGDLVVPAGGSESDRSILAYRFEGKTWSTIHAADSGVSYGTNDLAVADDGTLWISAWGSGLTGIGGPGGDLRLRGAFSAIGLGARGTAYVAGPSGIYRVRR